MIFSKDFIWGSGSSAFQVEGAADKDGKGRSIWDDACEEGHLTGTTDSSSCDCYNRIKQDVAIMKKIGLKAYRFSISWPRIMPDGIGKVNKAGIRYYNALIDELLANGIQPVITLYHWDLPSELHRRGGWLNPDISDWFYEYATVCAKEFGDRVKFFFTINEFQSFLGLGYDYGAHAPFQRLSRTELLIASHNALLAHGKAVMALRDNARGNVKISVAPCGVVKMPYSESDIEAARKATFGFMGKNVSNNTWFMDPIYFGSYPEDYLRAFSDTEFKYDKEDMKVINQRLDYFSFNVYTGDYVRDDGSGGYESVPHGINTVYNGMNWPTTPDCVYYGAKFFYERYKTPIIVSENGFCASDVKIKGETIDDGDRISYTKACLKGLERAAKEGADVRGYFYWSLMDNLEWTEGYRKRFGLVYIDYETKERELKRSALWYSDVIKNNGV